MSELYHRVPDNLFASLGEDFDRVAHEDNTA